jgi:exosortase C (VPDSG-CTERM-specific)
VKDISTRGLERKPDALAAEAKQPSRRIIATFCLGLLLLAFAPTLVALGMHVAQSELHSYVLLVPFITAYLLHLRWSQLPGRSSSSPALALAAAAAGLMALALARLPHSPIRPLSENDYLSAMTLSFVCLLIAGGFLFFGRRWMMAAAFPIAFLFFMIPMPDAMANALETASQYASAEAANLFFNISGTPVLRQGTVFQLPDITIRVAQECSGIRSSWILMITSLLASNLLLKDTWRRLVLVVFVIPLGILRNGFRVMVIGLLCVHFGPGMIDSVIHHRGGPLFFVMSLIPLFLLLWWLRRGEREPAATGSIASAGEGGPSQ